MTLKNASSTDITARGAIASRSKTTEFWNEDRSTVRFFQSRMDAGTLHGLRFTVLVAFVACVVSIFGAANAYASNYELLSQFGSGGSGDGQLVDPQGVAVEEGTHDVYVADAGNHRLEKFNGDGDFLATWGWGVSDGAAKSEVCVSGCQAGLAGSGLGQFTTPTAVAVDNAEGVDQGDVYVANEGSGVVEKFSSTGTYLASLSSGTSGPFEAILGIAVDKYGDLWVYDAGGGVYEFGDTGSEIQQWNTEIGASNFGLAVDSENNIYVQQSGQNVYEFSQAGTLLGTLVPGETNAIGLTVNLANDDLFSDQGTYVAQYEAANALSKGAVGKFGEGNLVAGTGVGVDPSTGDIYVADASSDDVNVFTSPSYGPPKVTRAYVDNVTAEGAEVHAGIETGEFDTTYAIEYGPTEAYGNVVPVTPVDIGSTPGIIEVLRQLSGLSAGTTYHYRVVARNSRGTATSGDHVFTTWSVESSTLLPDHRAYELVSPPEKDGAELEPEPPAVGEAASNGNIFTFNAVTAFGGAQSSRRTTYISTRGTEGWTTQSVVPAYGLPGKLTGGAGRWFFSENMSRAVFEWPEIPLVPGAPDTESMYLRDNTDGDYELLAPGSMTAENEFNFDGGSPDFSRVVFESKDALTKNAVAELKNVYEWSEGKLSLVSTPPGSSVGSPTRVTVGFESEYGSSDGYYPVSEDGGHVFWSDENDQLYSYDYPNGSVKINVSQRSPSLGDGVADFLSATPDGEFVFFTDKTPLTQGTADKGGLYQFDTNNGVLTDLTPDEVAEPAVLGLVGVSDDGGYVYFVAESSLATGAETDQPNLYVEHGGSVRLIGTLSSEDSKDWAQVYQEKTSTVTPSGLSVAFMSNAPLTGYDNRDAESGSPDSEVFEYDSNAAKLYCVSCAPTGAAPRGSAELRSWLSPNDNPHYLSEDGNRIFFDSSDTLVANDINSVQDVYEWESDGEEGCEQTNGCLSLLSNGVSPYPSSFDDATPSGNDVFITTRARLVPQDIDELIDYYDVRVDGGFQAPLGLAQCSGEGCLGPLTAPPLASTALTAGEGEEDKVDKNIVDRKATFELAPISGQELRNVARTGRLKVVVSVSEPGTVWAKISTKTGRRIRLVASSTMHTLSGGKVNLSLILAKAVRKELRAGKRLRLAVTAGYSVTKTTKLVTVIVGAGRTK